MARARISKDGDRVKLSLSFEEASAVRALLARVGPKTGCAGRLDDATSSLFWALDSLLDATGVGSEFDDFMRGMTDLIPSER